MTYQLVSNAVVAQGGDQPPLTSVTVSVPAALSLQIMLLDRREKAAYIRHTAGAAPPNARGQGGAFVMN
jgi:hypothetical protein